MKNKVFGLMANSYQIHVAALKHCECGSIFVTCIF